MSRRSAGIAPLAVAAAAACAQVASAFLIPAGVSPVETLSPLQIHAKHQLVALPCSECVFSSKSKQDVTEEAAADEPLFWIQGGANSVVVNITVSHDGQSLEVNGETVYPFSLHVQNLFDVRGPFVSQVPSSASAQDIEDGKVPVASLRVTGHGSFVGDETVVSDEGESLIPIGCSIFEVEGQRVSLDEITIQLLKTSSGDLSILHVDTKPTAPRLDAIFPTELEPEESMDAVPPPPKEHEPHGHRPHHHHHHGGDPHNPNNGKECEILPVALCKLRHMLEDKIRGFRKGGCPGRKGKHGRPHHHKGHGAGHKKLHSDRPTHKGHEHHHHSPGPHHHGRPHHMRPHGEHHGHHHGHHHDGSHKHHFRHSFTRGLAAVLIPTVAGVAVGMTVSLIGLVVGRAISFLWIRFYRGVRCGYASVALEDDYTEGEREKKEGSRTALLGADTETDAPPLYEDAPSYEESVKKDEQQA